MCNCVEKMDKHLAPMNTRLAQALMINVPKGETDARLLVTTVKIVQKKRGKPHIALATFCPFCGEKP